MYLKGAAADLSAHSKATNLKRRVSGELVG